MATGWVQLGSAWHYFDGSGYAHEGAGTYTIGGKYYYFNSDTHNSVYISGGWKDGRYFRAAGGSGAYAYTNTTTPDGYYVGSDGKKYTGWVGTTYYSGGLATTRTLTIKNTVTGQTSKAFTIKVSYNRNGTVTTENISLANGGSKTYTLPYNTTFTVTISDYTGYTKSITNASGTLTSNVTTSISYTQQYHTVTVTNTVKGTNVNCSYTLNATYADGGAHTSNKTFTLANGGSTSFSLPKGGKYTITQTAASGYTTTGGASNATLNGNATVAFTNTQLLKLTITNKVVGADKAFTYKVTIGGADKGTFTLSNGKSKTFDSIAYGSSYTVTQTDISGYTRSISGTASGTLNGNATVAYTNTQQLKLTITNKVVGADASFTYKVTVGGADKGTFTLSNGQSKVFDSIAYGTSYTVTQTDISGYTRSISGTASGTLTNNATVAYTNTQLLDLTITNQVIGPDNAFTYKVTIGGADKGTFTLSNGQSKTFEDIPYNSSYSVTQTPPDGSQYNTQMSDSHNGTLTGNATVAFTNTQLMALTITNQVLGENAEAGKSFDILLTYTAPGGSAQTTTCVLANGESLTLNLAYNTTYTVTSNYASQGYTTEGTFTEAKTLTAGITHTVTHTQQDATLTVTNTVNGSDEAKAMDFTYTLTVKYASGSDFAVDDGSFVLKNGESKVFTLPKNATYTITQTPVEGMRTAMTDSGNGALAENATVGFINGELVKLTVHKQVQGDNAQPGRTFDIIITYTEPGTTQKSITCTLADGGAMTYELAYNTVYTVTEDYASEGYSTTGTFTEGKTLTAEIAHTVVNTQEDRVLKVTNTVNATGEVGNIEFAYVLTVKYANGSDFPVTGGEFVLKHGESKEFTLPKNATYTVTQTPVEGFLTYLQDEGNGSLTQNATAAFINAEPLDLTIENQVSGVTAQPDKTFAITVTYTVPGGSPVTETLSLAHGQNHTYTDLPHGTTYTVTQTEDPGYTTGGAVTQAATLGVDTTVTLTNTAKEYTLVVGKTVMGNVGDQDYTFTLSVLRADGTTAYAPPTYLLSTGETKTLTDGEFTLRNGQTATFLLPAGCAYTVTETTTGSGELESVIVGNASVDQMTRNETVTFVESEMLELTVKNQVSGVTAQTDIGFDITVSYTIPGGSPVTDVITVAHGEGKTYTMPYGSTYTVTAATTAGYTASGSVTEAATLNQDQEVIITNTAKEYTLTVGKLVAGDATAQAQSFTFALTVLRADGTTAYAPASYLLNAEQTVALTNGTFTLSHGQTAAFVLPEGCSYLVTETDPGDSYLDPSTVGNASVASMTQDEIVTFTNTQLTTLKLKKLVDGNMGNKTREFGFAVKFLNGETPVPVQVSDQSAEVELSVAQSVYSVVLAHEEYVIFAVPYGVAYEIVEVEAGTSDGYQVQIAGADNAEGHTATGTAEAEEVTFTNTKDFSIPTAVRANPLPFVGMLVFGVALGVVLIMFKPSRRNKYM